MTDRKVFEKWWDMVYGTASIPESAELAWQAAAEHYEQVMQRAVVFAWMQSNGKGPQAEDIDGIIARAKGEG